MEFWDKSMFEKIENTGIEFEVGDRVRIKRFGERSYGYMNNEMALYQGREAIIIEVDSKYKNLIKLNIDGGKWCWRSDYVEKVEIYNLKDVINNFKNIKNGEVYISEDISSAVTKIMKSNNGLLKLKINNNMLDCYQNGTLTVDLNQTFIKEEFIPWIIYSVELEFKGTLHKYISIDNESFSIDEIVTCNTLHGNYYGKIRGFDKTNSLNQTEIKSFRKCWRDK